MAEQVSFGDLERVVAAIESACLCGQPLSAKELDLLDRVCCGRASLVPALAGPKLRLMQQCATRLWGACGVPKAKAVLNGELEARVRQLACELCSSTLHQPTDEEVGVLATHWAMAGRQWMLSKQCSEALCCFERALQPFTQLENKAQETAKALALAEVAFRCTLWAATTHFDQEKYDWAFEALQQAKEAIEASKHLQATVVDELQRCCYNQALAHHKVGNLKTAKDLLGLALAASMKDGEFEADPRALGQLMQLSALCYSDMGEDDTALKFASKAQDHSVNTCADLRVCCQQVLTRVSCKRTMKLELSRRDPRWEARVQEVQDAALVLMRDESADVDCCLGLCSFLLAEQFPGERVAECVTALFSRSCNCLEAKHKALRFQLQHALSVVEKNEQEETASWALAVLHTVLSDADALVAKANDDETARTCKEVSECLTHLAGRSCKADRPAEAAQWLRLMVPFVAENELADLWVEIAMQHSEADESEEAEACIRRALSHDHNHLQAIVLALRAAVGTDKQDYVRELVTKLQCHPRLDLPHAAAVAQALWEYHAVDLVLAALHMFASALPAKSSSAKNSDEKIQDPDRSMPVIVQLVQKACAAKRPSQELVRYLGLALEHASVQKLDLMEEKPVVDEVQAIIAAAWARAQELGRADEWTDSSAIFEAILKLVQLFDEAARSDLLEVRAWCLAMMSACALQHAKALQNTPNAAQTHTESALLNIDRAHQASRRATQVKGKRDSAPLLRVCAGGEESNIFKALVLLEFEVRCLSGDSEVQLKRFADEASSQETVGAKVLLAMAKIAMALSSRRLAIHCMQRFLRVLLGTGGIGKSGDYRLCAVAYRELIALHTSRNETFAVFEGVLQLLGGQNTGGVEGYPTDEVAWLVATAWNNGAHFLRLQQHRWAERWLAKSLALAKFCPDSGFDMEAMAESYKACVQSFASSSEGQGIRK